MSTIDLGNFGTSLNSFLASIKNSYPSSYVSLISALNFSSGTRFLQLSSTQIAIAAGADFLLVQGTGLSIAGSSPDGNVQISATTPITGTITGAELYAGGAFSPGTGQVTGGTLIASANFSASAIVLTSANLTLEIDGTHLPTTPATIESVIAGTYNGPAIGLSDIKLFNNNVEIGSVTLTSTAVTLRENNVDFTLAGNFPTSVAAAVIDQLVTGSGTG